MAGWHERAIDLKDGGMSNGDISKELGISYNTVKSFFYRSANRPVKQTVDLDAKGNVNHSLVIKVKDESKLNDPNYLMNLHGFDQNEFEFVEAKSSIWDVQMKGGKQNTFYASKISVKRKENPIDFDAIIKHLEKFRPQTFDLTPHMITSGKLLTVEYVDFHLGKLAWHEEVGQNFDMKIGLSMFDHVLVDTLITANQIKPEKIVFTVGNDFFHFDNIIQETTKGTRQDTDTRWQDLFVKGVDALINAIDSLSHIADVEVLYVPGNHDKQTSFDAFMCLKYFFHGNINIKFNENIQTRKYLLWGNTLLGFAHGKDEGKRIFECMQVEAAEQWGKSKFREFHMGHLHTEQDTIEKGGVIYRRLPTVTSTDAWTFESGYVGSVRKVKLFVYDKECGLIDMPLIPYFEGRQ